MNNRKTKANRGILVAVVSALPLWCACSTPRGSEEPVEPATTAEAPAAPEQGAPTSAEVSVALRGDRGDTVKALEASLRELTAIPFRKPDARPQLHD